MRSTIATQASGRSMVRIRPDDLPQVLSPLWRFSAAMEGPMDSPPIWWLYGDYMVNPGPMVPWWLPLIQKPLHIRKSCAMKLELVVSSWAQLQLFHVAHLERLLHNHHPTVTPIHVMPTSVIARIWVYIYIVTMASTIWIMFGWFPSASFFQRHDFRCPTQMSTCNSSLHWRNNLSSIWPAIKATVTMFYVWLSYLSCPGQTWSDLQSPIFISENRHV